MVTDSTHSTPASPSTILPPDACDGWDGVTGLLGGRGRSKGFSAVDIVVLGRTVPDPTSATNERVTVRATFEQRSRILRNQYVTIADAHNPRMLFLGRVVNGPFFPDADGNGKA